MAKLWLLRCLVIPSIFIVVIIMLILLILAKFVAIGDWAISQLMRRWDRWSYR